MTWTAAAALAAPLRLAGIAKEVTKGTWVTPSAYIAYEDWMPEDTPDWLKAEVNTGSMGMTQAVTEGVVQSALSVGGPVYPDTIGWPLAGVLGDLSTTGTAAPYTTVMSLLNSGTSQGQPTSHSLTDLYEATEARSYSAVQWYEIELTFSMASLLKYSAKGFGLPSAQQTTPSSPAISGTLPVPTWQFAATIGGSSTVIVLSATVTLSRAKDAITGMTASQAPVEFFLGPLTATYKLSALADKSDTALEWMLNNTQPTLELAASYGSGASTVGLEIHSDVCAFTKAALGTQNNYTKVDLEGEGVLNTTDAGSSGGQSPVQVTLKNAEPSGTYV